MGTLTRRQSVVMVKFNDRGLSFHRDWKAQNPLGNAMNLGELALKMEGKEMELCTCEVNFVQHGCVVFGTMSNLLSV